MHKINDYSKSHQEFLRAERVIPSGIYGHQAKEELGWVAEYGIREMCEDAWRWQKNNPNGYEE